MTEPENIYREMLKYELNTRLERNSNYSLRAFARDIFIDPGQLSRVLKGNQNISLGVAGEIASALFKKVKDKNLFLKSVEYSVSKNNNQKDRLFAEITKIKSKKNAISLTLEMFKVIKEWYHIAILDFTSLKGVKVTAESVSEKLGISYKQSNEAIERLLSLGLLENIDGKLQKKSKLLSTPTNIPSQAIKSYHRQMIQKALTSINKQSVEERYIVSKTFTLNKDCLNQVKELTDQYKKDLQEIVDQNDHHDSLYQLNIQIFNLINDTGNQS